MRCSHCREKLEDTGRFYPIGDVSVSIKLPYQRKAYKTAEGLCLVCQAMLGSELMGVVERYQKEKASE